MATSVCGEKKEETGHDFKIYRKKATISVEYTPCVLTSGKEVRRLKGSGEGEGDDGGEASGNRYCDAPKHDLLFDGPSEGQDDCEEKCTLAAGCVFFSISDKKECVLTSTCDTTRIDTKGATWLTFKQKGDSGIVTFAILGLLLLCLACCLCIVLCCCCCRKKDKDKYTPVDHGDITKQIEEEMGGTPVTFKDHDYHLKPEGEQVVAKVAKVLKRHTPEECCVKILGYTGKPHGKWKDHELCEKLGYKRALRIMEVLEREGCKHKIAPIGYGNVVGKGATCEIHACTDEEAEAILREAKDKGQDPDMIIP